MTKTRLCVFLDTNIFSAAPKRDNIAFNRLAMLAKSEEIVVHVSDIAVREFVTQQSSNFERTGNVLAASIKDIRRKVPPRLPVEKTLERIDELFEVLRGELKNVAEKGLPVWLQSIGAQVHAPSPDHTTRIFESYFEGGIPFKQKKSRDDIPDAFILEALKDCVPKPAHAIIKDQYLNECAAQIPGVTAYADLDSFFQSPIFQEHIHSAMVKAKVDILVRRLTRDPSALQQIVETQVVDLISGRQIESTIIPEDNNTASISMVDVARDISYSEDEAEYYGDGVIRLPFQANVDVLADYSIFKADYYVLDDERTKGISISDWNDHYFAAEENFTVDIYGALSIRIKDSSLSGKLDKKQLDSIVSEAQVNVDDVTEIEVLGPAG